ncbi:NAD(P)H-binding protein [Streptomyces sp. NPDC048331]|uniref:NAD(P)H-binding protein n=1 Tax=Streptomyces sp. NPDC048331 TaxID=3365534 RepID=UPI003716B665
MVDHVTRGTVGVEHVIPPCRVTASDLTEPATLEPALAGAKALFLLLSADLHDPGATAPAEIVARAAAGGVRRVVLLSTQGVATRPYGATRITMRALEERIQESGMEWSVLRPGGFASNALWWAPSVRTRRVVAAPFADVGVPVVDPWDIADVAAACLLEDRHLGGVYELTGPQVITPRRQARTIATALGAPLRFHDLTREEAKAAMTRAMPAELADDTLDILGAPTEAERRVGPAVRQVLNRPARPFADRVSRDIAAFR